MGIWDRAHGLIFALVIFSLTALAASPGRTVCCRIGGRSVIGVTVAIRVAVAGSALPASSSR